MKWHDENYSVWDRERQSGVRSLITSPSGMAHRNAVRNDTQGQTLEGLPLDQAAAAASQYALL
jgi:hypothetical protein